MICCWAAVVHDEETTGFGSEDCWEVGAPCCCSTGWVPAQGGFLTVATRATGGKLEPILLLGRRRWIGILLLQFCAGVLRCVNGIV